jgi:hypothetical protein
MCLTAVLCTQLVPQGTAVLPKGWTLVTDAKLLLEAQARGYYPSYRRAASAEGFVANFLQRHTHIRVPIDSTLFFLLHLSPSSCIMRSCFW